MTEYEVNWLMDFRTRQEIIMVISQKKANKQI